MFAKGAQTHGSGVTGSRRPGGDAPSVGQLGHRAMATGGQIGHLRRKLTFEEDHVTKLPPPGLGGKTKQQKSEVEQTLRQAWSSLPTECQQALKGMGLDFTPEPEPQPLEELLKAHLESLPKEVKEVVEGLLKPAPAASVDVTGQLKATVGELRPLTTKKQSLQKRVDQAKESYKMLLDELKIVQEAIDKEHKQLGNQSEAYAKQLKEEALPTTPPAEHVLHPDITEHVMKAMGQAGIIFTVEQQKELERNLAETIAKRRKTVGDAQLSG